MFGNSHYQEAVYGRRRGGEIEGAVRRRLGRVFVSEGGQVRLR